MCLGFVHDAFTGFSLFPLHNSQGCEQKKKKARKERHSIKPTFFDFGFILVIPGRSAGESQPQ